MSNLKDLLKKVTKEQLPYARIAIVREVDTAEKTTVIEPADHSSFDKDIPTPEAFIYNAKYSPNKDKAFVTPKVGAFVFAIFFSTAECFIVAIDDVSTMGMGGTGTSKVFMETDSAALAVGGGDPNNTQGQYYMGGYAFIVDLVGNTGQYILSANELTVTRRNRYAFETNCGHYVKVDCSSDSGVQNVVNTNINPNATILIGSIDTDPDAITSVNGWTIQLYAAALESDAKLVMEIFAKILKDNFLGVITPGSPSFLNLNALQSNSYTRLTINGNSLNGLSSTPAGKYALDKLVVTATKLKQQLRDLSSPTSGLRIYISRLRENTIGTLSGEGDDNKAIKIKQYVNIILTAFMDTYKYLVGRYELGTGGSNRIHSKSYETYIDNLNPIYSAGLYGSLPEKMYPVITMGSLLNYSTNLSNVSVFGNTITNATDIDMANEILIDFASELKTTATLLMANPDDPRYSQFDYHLNAADESYTRTNSNIKGFNFTLGYLISSLIEVNMELFKVIDNILKAGTPVGPMNGYAAYMPELLANLNKLQLVNDQQNIGLLTGAYRL